MKRFLIVCAAALAVLAASEQKASANFKINFSAGLNFSCEFGGCYGFCFGCGCAPSGCGVSCYPGYGYGAAYQGGYCYAPQAQAWGGDGSAYAVAPQYAPQTAPAQKAAPVSTPTAQQIGYYPSAGYYQAPSYWYGN
jgi:hypothetical protein